MFANDSFTREVFILVFLLLGELASLGLSMRNFDIDIFIVEAEESQVSLDFYLIGNMLHPLLSIENSFVVDFAIVGMTKEQHSF